jgi:4-amino-4-deoxy-L-arabinose transferase-like glycosyltransferase
VYCFHRAATKPVWIAAFFAVSGISTLIKGPVSFIILMVFALSCCLVTGKWHMLFNRWTPAGIFLAVAGIALWPLAVYLRGAWKEWFDFFIIGENVGKFHEKIHYPGYRITGYFLQYLIPWSPLFLMSLWVWLKTKSYRKYETVSPFIWMLAIVIIHLLPETKLKHYVIPAIPPAAILIASCAEVKEPAMRAGKILTQVFLGLILLGTLGLFRLTEGWTNLLFIGLALILLCYSISAAHRDVNACALSYGCSLILLIAAISSLTFYRLPGDGLACTKGHRVAVIRLQSYLYSYDVGSFTPQLTNAVDFNLFLLDGGRIIISESDLREFSTIKGFKLVPVVRLYTWKQWKKSLPLEKIISVLWSGNKRELIEEMYIVEKSPDF